MLSSLIFWFSYYNVCNFSVSDDIDC